MSMTPSAAGDVRTLIASLGADDEIRREAAIARLAIIGPRAVERLLAEYAAADGNDRKRIAILRVFEAVGDPRAIPIAREALAQPADVAVAATAVLQAFLESLTEGAAAESLDALVTAALDPQCQRRVRIAALDALQGMPEDVRARVAATMANDADPALQSRATASPTAAGAADAIWQDAIEGTLPDRAEPLRHAMQTRAASTSLNALRKLIEALREHESMVEPAQVRQWLSARGGVHQALALRGSKVAVCDLRETVAASTHALPTTFLTALHVVGDESCLDAIAAAYTAAGSAAGTAKPDYIDDTSNQQRDRWLQQLTAAFHAIVKREKIGRKAATLTRISHKWPAAAAALNTTSRTMPRPKSRART
jgi:hypothetical protein